jgi:hypothetical protein
MEKRELKHWINNARQMLVGAEDLLAKADKDCEINKDDLTTLDKYVWGATKKLHELDSLISEMQNKNHYAGIMQKIDAKLDEGIALGYVSPEELKDAE